jgi:hypothetical protein
VADLVEHHADLGAAGGDGDEHGLVVAETRKTLPFSPSM